MVIRKLAVPLINEKILNQAEHCYIATAGITDAGFDFIRSRIPTRTKIDLVTGLDEPTSPNVLRRILRNYQERITVKIFSRNFFHPNLYIFDLPFRKSVAFLGSGTFSLEGLKDQEELFWKVTDAKQIESLLSWFTGFYEFGTPLTENIIIQYERVYPAIKKRDIISGKQKELAIESSSIQWELIKWKNQFFKKDDFQSFFSDAKILPDENQTEVEKKLNSLQENLKPALASKKLFPVRYGEQKIKSEGFGNDASDNLPSQLFGFGKSEAGFNAGFARLEIGISPAYLFLRIRVLSGGNFLKEREFLLQQLNSPVFLSEFFAKLSQTKSVTVEVMGQRKGLEYFQKDQNLLEFISTDVFHQFDIFFEKRCHPSDPNISMNNIISVLTEELSILGKVLASIVNDSPS